MRSAQILRMSIPLLLIGLGACKSSPTVQAQREIREAQEQTSQALNTTQEAIRANEENREEVLKRMQSELNDTDQRVVDLENQRREVDQRITTLRQRRAEAVQQMETYRTSNEAQLQATRVNLERAMQRLREAYQVASRQ